MDELRSLRTMAGVLPLALLAACSDAPAERGYADQLDPVVAQALSDQLMVDPDLVGQNEANAALVSSADGSIPTEIATQAAIRDAIDQASDILAERGADANPPEPEALAVAGEQSPLELLSRQVMRVPAAARCFGTASYSAIWAARLPDQLPVYPRAGTMEAMGSDQGDCAMRAVRSQSPVPMEDVRDFYFRILSAGGFSPRYSAGDGQHRIEGSKGAMAVAVHIRPSLEGLTEVDLVTADR